MTGGSMWRRSPIKILPHWCLSGTMAMSESEIDAYIREEVSTNVRGRQKNENKRVVTRRSSRGKAFGRRDLVKAAGVVALFFYGFHLVRMHRTAHTHNHHFPRPAASSGAVGFDDLVRGQDDHVNTPRAAERRDAAGSPSRGQDAPRAAIDDDDDDEDDAPDPNASPAAPRAAESRDAAGSPSRGQDAPRAAIDDDDDDDDDDAPDRDAAPDPDPAPARSVAALAVRRLSALTAGRGAANGAFDALRASAARVDVYAAVLTDIYLTGPRSRVRDAAVAALRARELRYANPGDEPGVDEDGTAAGRRRRAMRILDPKAYGAYFHRRSLYRAARGGGYDAYVLSFAPTLNDDVWADAREPLRLDGAEVSVQGGLTVLPGALAARFFAELDGAGWWCYAGRCDVDLLRDRLNATKEVARQVPCCPAERRGGL